MRNATLVVMAKAPELGRVKTRLAASIGPMRALAVYIRLLRHTMAVASAWPGPVLLAWTGDESALAGFGATNWARQHQRGDSLGERLAAALGVGLAATPCAMVIGTDCPALTPSHLERLHQLALATDCAMGPATDGGFWGFATRRLGAVVALAAPDLPWSTAHTGAAVRGHLRRRGFDCALGPPLSDLDTVDDLHRAGWSTWPPLES